MLLLDEFLSRIDEYQLQEVQRIKTLYTDNVVYRYFNCYVTLVVFSTKMYINVGEHSVIYDPAMNHLIFNISPNTPDEKITKYKNITRYITDEAFAFQQSLLQEPLFSTESLEALFEFHNEFVNNIPPVNN